MNDSSNATCHAASEEDLACRVQDGCTDSFTELVHRFQPRLAFVLQRRLPVHADVEDVLQKTFWRAYEKINLYDTTKKFGPWLFTIALRIATDHNRQHKRQLPLPSHPTGESASAVVDPGPTPDQQAIAQEQSQDLWAIAERILQPDQWTALWLQCGEGQTAREIAQTLGRSTVSTRVLLFRTRKKLLPHLAKYSGLADNEPPEIDSAETIPQPAPEIMRAEL